MSRMTKEDTYVMGLKSIWTRISLTRKSLVKVSFSTKKSYSPKRTLKCLGLTASTQWLVYVYSINISTLLSYLQGHNLPSSKDMSISYQHSTANHFTVFDGFESRHPREFSDFGFGSSSYLCLLKSGNAAAAIVVR